MSTFIATLTTPARPRQPARDVCGLPGQPVTYRTWLCAISFSRCGEASPSLNSKSACSDPEAQIVLPALQKVRARATPRNLALPTFAPEYETVLPYLWTARVLSSWAARRAMRRMCMVGEP